MEIGLTRLSSKGQVVIPRELRDDLKEGEQLVVIKNKHQLILKKVSTLDRQFKEDLEFAKRTEAAWKRYERGLFKSMDADKFVKELDRW